MKPIGGSADFNVALQKYWGYSSFRPKQQEVVQALDAGRDVCVVMPTGGGKSLCYQLPAVMKQGQTAVVISPLIALMKDQVLQLRQMGIEAEFLNSSVAGSDRGRTRKKAVEGAYRLLYLSPERVVMEDTAAWLKDVPVSFFAIDEAHCISEWGHDFRPEYRQLGRLRGQFPGKPIAAFTASATQRVRHDIVEQLGLRKPFTSVSSFYRENLRYFIRECKKGEQDDLVVEALRRAGEGSAIVYTSTRARVGEVVNLLEEADIPAIGYHGQMTGEERSTNQEKWMSGEVRVLVGTIAFGLGINKPDVRAVVRLGLPESIEQLYQEMGRAGRDGKLADCYLLWEPKDHVLRKYFLKEISSDKERAQAEMRYDTLKRFVASKLCRQKSISGHFGETLKVGGCGKCDCCAGEPGWIEQTGRKAGERLERRVRGIEAASYTRTETVNTDEPLCDFVREWRWKRAREQKVPAIVILQDTTLMEFCSRRPKNFEELSAVPGMGDAKKSAYGKELLGLLRRFEGGERAGKEWKQRATSASQETVELLREGLTFEEIAQRRGRKVRTIVELVAAMIEKSEVEYRAEWMSQERYEQIRAAAEEKGLDLLKPIKEMLPEEVSYEEIRLVAADLRRQKWIALKAAS